jgi:Succinylglutamate desuccinylase / Aspartoacylase family
MKNLLIIGCTHGDEQIGRFIFNTIPQGYNEHWNYKTLIANPRAMFLNTRFVETDLNRSFNKENPISYEEKRALLISKELKMADLVIDIHQTTANMDHCAFIVDNTPELLNVCKYLSIKHIVIGGGFGGKKKDLLLENCNGSLGGIALEYSKNGNYESECAIVQKDIENLISKKITHSNQSTYRLVGKLENKPSQDLSNWVAINEVIKKEIGFEGEIYPIFIGEKAYESQYCTLVKKIKS